MKKIRIDQLIFKRGLEQSREKAKALIMSGMVLVDGERVDKAGEMVLENLFYHLAILGVAATRTIIMHRL